MDLYVLDANFKKIEIISYAESIIWTKRYFSLGDFEIVLPASRYLLQLFRSNEDRYIMRPGDQTGIIVEKIQLTTDEESGDKLIISGPTFQGLLKRRIVWGQKILKGTLLDCILLGLVADNAMDDSIISGRRLEYLSIRPNISMEWTGENPHIEKQVTDDVLSDAVISVCTAYGIGWEIYFENGKLLFNLYHGKDRSSAQNILPVVKFSPKYGNYLNGNYTFDKSNYKNVAMVAGEGEGTARKMAAVGNAVGRNRYEVFVDQSSLSTNEGEISDIEYMNQLKMAGEEKLAEYGTSETYDSTVDPDVNYRYGKDYNLGDIVEVENEYGIISRARITEVIESEDENGYTCVPKFESVEG